MHAAPPIRPTASIDSAPAWNDPVPRSEASAPSSAWNRLQAREIALFWLALVGWLCVFVCGTLIDSGPFRARFADFHGFQVGPFVDGLIVVATFTLTNVGLLCVFSSSLGALGARVGLGADGDGPVGRDATAPAISAVLRGFFVYMTVLAGVMVFADRPVEPTQTQYVRLAGITSLLSFLVNYNPTRFGNLLRRAGDVLGKE